MRLRILPSVLLPAVLLLGLPGCTSEDPDPRVGATIAREVFVQAYVDLRVAALRSLDQRVSAGARSQILDDLGISEEDLLTFVEVWGEDIDLMKGIWSEVDSILRESRERPQGPGDPGGASP